MGEFVHWQADVWLVVYRTLRQGSGRRIPTTPSKWLTCLKDLSAHGVGKSGGSLADAELMVGKVPALRTTYVT